MHNISILIVEDEPNLLDRLVQYLDIFCDTIYQASNGREALEIYKKNLPNILLTDINMPKLTGVELIEDIRSIKHNCEIIVLSAHTNTEDFLRVIPLNLASYLIKPLQMGELKKVIVETKKKIVQNRFMALNHGYEWNQETKSLQLETQKIELTSNESAFLEILILKLNQSVSYEEIHNYVYNLEEYSQDAIFSLAKRVRKKTTKDLIKSSFKYGYILESN
jgi:DNA-binding response OmpR family regulator